MVISPILRGMFGLQTDVEKRQIRLEPHVPADWTSYALHNVHLGDNEADFRFTKAADSITLAIQRKGSGDCWLEFSPAFSLRTQVLSVRLNGKPVSFKLQPNDNDQHLDLRVPLSSGGNTLVIRMKDDFGLTLTNELPHLGSAGGGLRIIDQSWNSSRTELTVNVSGLAGARYELGVWNSSQIAAVEGAALNKFGKLEIEMAKGVPESYTPQKVVIHFRNR
jgi:hypothetical protein